MTEAVPALRLAEGDCLQTNMSETSLRSLHELREQGLLCDAVLKLEDGSTLPVHRALLSASSPYFRALFTTTLHEEERREVVLIGIEPEIARELVRFVYLRRVGVSPANVTKLLAAADYLALLGVRKLCSDYLKELITPETAISILLYARDHFCPELEKEALSYILRQFVEVSQRSPDILELDVDEVKDLIGSDELNVKNEEAVWEFVVRWVDHQPAERKPHLPILIGLIRLGLMNEGYFLEKVKEHRYISGNEACRPIIIDTLRFLYDLEMIGQSEGEVATPAIARPRIPHEVLFAIGGWSGGSPTACIETYDTRADRWVKVPEIDPSGPRAYHGTAVIGHDIFVIGGFDGIEYFNSVRCFNAATKSWREVAPMNSKRCYVSVAVLNDVIYAMGGYDGHHRQNTAEKYDFRTNQWTMIAPMNAQRSDACATTLNGKIYITGGFNGQECLNSAEVYDPDANIWATIPPMRSRRSGVSCIGYQGCLYVIGGFNGISRMCSGEKFNPSTITWSSIPDMYNPRSNFAIEVIDDMIFTIGGFNGVTTIYHVECFDGKTNDWLEAAKMGINRSALACSVVRGLPDSSIFVDRDTLMIGRRLHSGGDHLSNGVLANNLNEVQEYVSGMSHLFQENQNSGEQVQVIEGDSRAFHEDNAHLQGEASEPVLEVEESSEIGFSRQGIQEYSSMERIDFLDERVRPGSSAWDTNRRSYYFDRTLRSLEEEMLETVSRMKWAGSRSVIMQLLERHCNCGRNEQEETLSSVSVDLDQLYDGEGSHGSLHLQELLRESKETTDYFNDEKQQIATEVLTAESLMEEYWNTYDNVTIVTTEASVSEIE